MHPKDENPKLDKTQATAAKTAARSKGAAHPAMPLEDAINAVAQIKEKLGDGPYSREDIAQALGHASLSGPASSKIAACCQFGLLDRSTGGTCSLSSLAHQILIPTDEVEKRAAVLRAATMPPLYSRLVERYRGQALPTMLSNILVREHGISESAAKSAVDTFRKSLTFVGLFENGVIRGETVDTTDSVPDENLAPVTAPAELAHAPVIDRRRVTIVIPDTEIEVTFPAELAFALSTGAFMGGLKALKQDADTYSKHHEEA